MSKFDDTLAEAAYAVAGHGFTEDEFGTVDDIGWNAVVVVSPTILLNLGETEIRDAYENLHGNDDLLVWVREDSQGFVSVVEYGSDSGLRSGTDLVNEAFDKARDEFDLMPTYGDLYA